MTVGNCLMCGDKLKYYDSVRPLQKMVTSKSGRSQSRLRIDISELVSQRQNY